MESPIGKYEANTDDYRVTVEWMRPRTGRPGGHVHVRVIEAMGPTTEFTIDPDAARALAVGMLRVIHR